MRRVVTSLAAAAVFAAGGTVAMVQANERPPVSREEAALPRPILQRPPVFLTRGKPAQFKALAAGNPKQLRLIVEGARGTRTIPLAAEGGAYAGRIDGADTQTDSLTVRVEATYATTTLSSTEYTVVPTSAPVVATPVQQELSRTDAVNWAWGTGATEFGRVSGDEGATIVPSSIATKPDGTIAVLDTANARVLEFDLGGHVVNSTPLPSQTIDYLVSDPVSGDLTAIDVVNFVAYTIQDNTYQTINQLNLASLVDSLRGFYVSGIGSTQHTIYGLLGDGSTVPVIIDGVAATVSQQELYRQVGIPTNGGFLLFEKADNALRLGITSATGGAGSSPVAPNVSVPLAETVLDVTPIDVRKLHKLAFLVTTFSNGAVKDNLVRVNLTTGEATIADVTVDVPGDMTTRAAPLDTNVGIVLFTGNSTGGQVAVFNGLGV